jgi:hypothetical protein
VIVSHHTALQAHITISGYGFLKLIPFEWLALIPLNLSVPSLRFHYKTLITTTD